MTGLRGSHVGSFEVAHAISWEGKKYPLPTTLTDDLYGLVVVVGYRTDNWRVSAYVENVFDGVWYDGNYADDPTPFYIYSQHAFGPSRPRTAGLRVGIEF